MWRSVRRPFINRCPRCGCHLCRWRGCWRAFLDARWIVRVLRGWRRPARPSSRSSSCCGFGGSATRTRTSCTALYEVWSRRCFLIGSCVWTLLLTVCPSRGAPLWEESIPLQQLKKPDPERPPDRRRQLAGGQSSSGGRPGCGFFVPPQAVHSTAASPLADGELWPRSGQRPVAQSEGHA